jgi:hypothetical protein
MTTMEVMLGMAVCVLGYWIADLCARLNEQSQRLDHDTSRIDGICAYLVAKQAEQRQVLEGDEWKHGIVTDGEDE